jgi:hypothetical protein
MVAFAKRWPPRVGMAPDVAVDSRGTVRRTVYIGAWPGCGRRGEASATSDARSPGAQFENFPKSAQTSATNNSVPPVIRNGLTGKPKMNVSNGV